MKRIEFLYYFMLYLLRNLNLYKIKMSIRNLEIVWICKCMRNEQWKVRELSKSNSNTEKQQKIDNVLLFSQYLFDFSLFCYSSGNPSIVIHSEGNCFIRKDIKLKHIGILKRDSIKLKLIDANIFNFKGNEQVML